MTKPFGGLDQPAEIATGLIDPGPGPANRPFQFQPEEIRTMWQDAQRPDQKVDTNGKIDGTVSSWLPADASLEQRADAMYNGRQAVGEQSVELQEYLRLHPQIRDQFIRDNGLREGGKIVDGLDFPGAVDPLKAYEPQLALVPRPLLAEAHAVTVPTKTEHHVARNIIVATLAAVILVQTLDWLAEAKVWETKGRFDGPGFDRRMSKVFRKRLGPALAPLCSGMLLMGRGTVGDALSVAYSQDQAAPVAARWAQSYGNKVAADYAATSAEAVGGQVASWINQGLPAPAMAARARAMYGLDPRAAHALAKYTAGKGKDRVTLVERYLESRAQTNASVWTMAAQNAGREMLFTELVEAGLLPKHTRKVWITARDERTCPICRPMDNVSVPLGTRFHVGGSHLLTAPVHPSCRCTISIDTEPEPGLAFPKDFMMMHGWLRSATRTVYR